MTRVLIWAITRTPVAPLMHHVDAVGKLLVVMGGIRWKWVVAGHE